MNQFSPIHPIKNQTGLSLTEVLISLLVMSVSVLGYVGLQKKSLDMAQETFWRNQAAAIGSDLVERIQANPVALKVYSDQKKWADLKVSEQHPCLGEICSPDELAQGDMREIKRQAAQSLPLGHVVAKDRLVFVSWSGIAATDCKLAEGHCVRLEL